MVIARECGWRRKNQFWKRLDNYDEFVEIAEKGNKGMQFTLGNNGGGGSSVGKEVE